MHTPMSHHHLTRQPALFGRDSNSIRREKRRLHMFFRIKPPYNPNHRQHVTFCKTGRKVETVNPFILIPHTISFGPVDFRHVLVAREPPTTFVVGVHPIRTSRHLPAAVLAPLSVPSIHLVSKDLPGPRCHWERNTNLQCFHYTTIQRKHMQHSPITIGVGHSRQGHTIGLSSTHGAALFRQIRPPQSAAQALADSKAGSLLFFTMLKLASKLLHTKHDTHRSP